jgi:Arc/MetJ-type ribon-helix-helix transcriptional regulator
MSINIRLPKELEAKLRLRLDAQGFGLSEFVREAIAEKLDREAAGRPSAYELGRNVFYGFSQALNPSCERRADCAEQAKARRARSPGPAAEG